MWTQRIDKAHYHLREIATTLNYFCLVEISVILFFSYQCYDLLTWYKGMITPENFNGNAFWGAMTAIGLAVIGAIKYINDTRQKRGNDNYGFDKKRERGMDRR